MDKKQRPIGVFDSGLGGLTVLQEMIKLLPGENTIYFGDSGRMPYGTKSSETVVRFSLQNTRFLLEQDVKAIVIACNTASARAWQAVRDYAGVPVIEVITPGARAAAEISRSGRIGVIGTRGTIESDVYRKAIEKSAKGKAKVYQQPCPLFVSLAEEGWWDNEVARKIAEIYLSPLRDDIDSLVLGCTHYPLLKKTIASVMGPEVALIDSGSQVALEVKKVLETENLLNNNCGPGWHKYYTSDSARHFRDLGSRFLDQIIEEAYHIDIDQYQLS